MFTKTTNNSVNLDPSKIRIESGYRPALLGRVTTMHANFYYKYYSFGSVFETKVAKEMAEFLTRLDHPHNEVWAAIYNDEIIGSISLDGEDLGEGKGHIRWFIVDDEVRGAGFGKKLLSTAIEFSDNNKFKETHLWTFKGLDAARRLYEREKFALMNEKVGSQWGTEVVEQRFVRQGMLSIS